MKNASNNVIDGLQDIFSSPLSDGEKPSPENPPVGAEETAAQPAAPNDGVSDGGETAVQPAVPNDGISDGETAAQPAAPNDGISDSGGTAVQPDAPNSETANAGENTAEETAVSGEISDRESGAGTVYTAPSPVGAGGGGEIQMPIALLALLIGAVCVLGAVTVFLISRLKKSPKSPGGENQLRAAERPAGIPVNQNEGGGKSAAEIRPDPEKGAENMDRFAEVPVTVVPDGVDFRREFSYEIANVHNQGRREEQQDSFCISDVSSRADLESKGLMAVVADGMGGLESGASVSQLVSNIFLNKYRGGAIPDCKSFLYEAVMESEREVEKYIEVNHVDGGSTLVAVMIREGRLSFISVGDSFIFLIRAGKLIKLNTEHTYGNLLRERAARGEVDPEEAEINPKRASLTSYIGIGNLRLIDRSDEPIPLLEGDILFLCSDGVYNALGDNALLEVVTGGAFGEAAERVEQSVLMQNIPTQDNFTAVMIRIMEGK